MKTKSECRSCKEQMELLDTNCGLRFICLTEGCPIHTLTTKDVIIYGFASPTEESI